MHFDPCPFDTRESNYDPNHKSSYALVIDADRAVFEDRHAFCEIPSGVILSDGDAPTESEGILSLVDSYPLFKSRAKTCMRAVEIMRKNSVDKT